MISAGPDDVVAPQAPAAPPVTRVGRAVRARGGRRADGVVALAVFAVAATVRITLIASSRGGLRGNLGYDSGVYYAGADALVHGRLPYADWTLLHPPAVTLVTAPFAFLGTVTTDHAGFVAANLAYELLGGVNAALVFVVARRFGLTRAGAAAGGVFYAVWFSAAAPEVAVRLEPLGVFAFLLGLLAVPGLRGPRSHVAAGFALGAAVTTKIWWVAPVVLVLGWLLVTPHRRRDARWVLLGTLAAGALIAGPFLVNAPGAMWRMIVTDQVGRTRDTPALDRLQSLTSAQTGITHAGTPRDLLTALVAVLVVLAAVSALRRPLLRPVVLVLAAQVGLLFAAPSFFPAYAGFVTPTCALVVGCAASDARRLRLARYVGAPVAAVLVVVSVWWTVGVELRDDPTLASPFPDRGLAAATRSAHCVTSDAPFALISLDVLSRDLDRGCPNWVDVVGRVYDVDAGPDGRVVARVRNAAWQRDLSRYLLSSDAVILMRSSTGVGPALLAELHRYREISPGGGVHLFVIGHRPHPGTP